MVGAGLRRWPVDWSGWLGRGKFRENTRNSRLGLKSGRILRQSSLHFSSPQRGAASEQLFAGASGNKRRIWLRPQVGLEGRAGSKGRETDSQKV